ncbi:hypothetical protein LI328DRAFT_123518 [Trichoderma asperelloides]|nr:hypothetical protein LI328DRAFT_123518 [Trichoderma asperelloides]
MFRNVSRPLNGRWPCTLPRLLAEMARTIPPRQKDGATTGRGAGEVILIVTTEHMRLTYSWALCPGKVDLDGV